MCWHAYIDWLFPSSSQSSRKGDEVIQLSGQIPYAAACDDDVDIDCR